MRPTGCRCRTANSPGDADLLAQNNSALIMSIPMRPGLSGDFCGLGFIAGAIANFIMHTHLGFIMTTLLGIVGSIIGDSSPGCSRNLRKALRFTRLV
jgi:hypothetical protein